MDILGKARKLEARIARTVDHTAQRLLKSTEREPLEVVHAIVDLVEEEVQPAGRGTQVFPFNRLTVSVVATSREARARFAAVLNGHTTLHERIVERLEAARCKPLDLVVRIAYMTHAKPDWPNANCHVEFERVLPTSLAAHEPPPDPRSVTLTIIAGAADQSEYSVALSRIDLGRCAEVRDRRNRLIRINHVAFADSDSPTNQSVSRCHAHIECGGGADQCRVYDDHSKQGTGVLRHGKTIAVPPGSIGVRLQSGDEIVLGEARVRFAQASAAVSR